jgi:uncharacterized membrane protein
MKHIIEEPKDSNWTIFKDTNDWNEKAIIGAISFLIMVVVFIVDFLLSKFIKQKAIKVMADIESGLNNCLKKYN